MNITPLVWHLVMFSVRFSYILNCDSEPPESHWTSTRDGAFNGSPCYSVNYYNNNSIWPYYIVIHSRWHLILEVNGIRHCDWSTLSFCYKCILVQYLYAYRTSRIQWQIWQAKWRRWKSLAFFWWMNEIRKSEEISIHFIALYEVMI